MQNYFTQGISKSLAVVAFISGIAADGKAAQLIMCQQLEMCRNCAITYKDRSAQFASRMCGCNVGAYMGNISARKPVASVIHM